VLRVKDVQELEELTRQGLSIRPISRLTGYDRKTISISATPRRGASVWAASETAGQARSIPALLAGTDEGLAYGTLRVLLTRGARARLPEW